MTPQRITLHHFFANTPSLLTELLEERTTFYELPMQQKTYYIMNEHLLPRYLIYKVKLLLKKESEQLQPIEQFIDSALEDLSYIRANEQAIELFYAQKEQTMKELFDDTFEILYIDAADTSAIILESTLLDLKVESIIGQYNIFYPDVEQQAMTQAQRSLLKIAERIHVFDGIQSSDILAITKDVIFLRFEEGETIFKQASDGQNMYYILSGAIEILHNELNAPRKIATLVHDELFGEIAPILNQPRSTAAVALKQSTLLSFEIDKSKKQSYQEAFITLYENFIATLSKKILKSNHQLIDTHH